MKTDLAELYKAWNEDKKQRRRERYESADPEGWEQHNANHWHRTIGGKKLNYWPSTGLVMIGRNRRSVWTVTTKPFKGAHFATFPPDLIEPCILAGCPEGGVVLDPFGGSGTTAGVAIRHNRLAVLCELNPEYAALVPGRIDQITGGQPWQPISRR